MTTAKALRRVQLNTDTNLLRILEEVHCDRTPRLIERDGQALAVVIIPEDYTGPKPAPKSKRLKKRLLALAGAWSDLDADRMIKELYEARHESPPSIVA